MVSRAGGLWGPARVRLKPVPVPMEEGSPHYRIKGSRRGGASAGRGQLLLEFLGPWQARGGLSLLEG